MGVISRREPQLGAAGEQGVKYKWIALSNTTLSMTMATIDGSIVIIAMPAIFRGIHLSPLAPGNISYVLWMIMGYLLVQAVLVVTLGRLGDMFGRVKIYNLGFVVFTLASIALSLDPLTGGHGALWLIGWRMVQAFGGAMLMANSAAILTDAFPANQRGMALGINQIAGISGQFVGLLLGGLLAAWDWRAVFWVNVPIGVWGTIWAYRSLREIATTKRGKIDWAGNVLFAIGATSLLAAITYGIQPYGGHATGWTNPLVISGLAGGVAFLVVFCIVETKIAEPMFRMGLFKIRAFAAGNAASLMSSMARGGLQFMLVIWLAGHLAAAARLRLHRHPAVGGHLHAAADRRLPDRRADLGRPVRPLRLAPVRDGRPAGRGLRVHRAAAPADQLPVSGLRGDHLLQRPWLRAVRVAQHVLDHEQRPGRAPRRGVRHAVGLPELGHVAVDRLLLLADDRRTRCDAPPHPQRGPARPGRARSGSGAHRQPAAGQHAVLGAARLQPDQEPAGADRSRWPGCPRTTRRC